MLAYHSNPSIKTSILAQLEAHRAADEIQKGFYWQHGKGCAVGCTVHSSDHGAYETQFGIPRILARLEDGIFEGLPDAVAKDWPIKFMSAIRPGADLAGVWPKFAVWLLTDEACGMLRLVKTDEQRAIIQEVADNYARGEADKQKLLATRERAWRVRTSAAAADAAAYAAAAYAADAADAAAAAYAADAADAAADAADAAYADAYAADARRRRAGGVGVSSSPAAASAARRTHREAQAEKLLELLAAA